jgi:DeoR/GlpR family transcriptional regulator of sugar metabolism
MRGSARRAAILESLRLHGEVSVEDLATELTVTTSTIRRDLAELAAEGKVTRTYGGAVIPAEPPVLLRAGLAGPQKDAIGAWAAAQVQDGETVLLDAGTTVARAARRLRDRSKLTIVTNGLTSLAEVADGCADVIVLGGQLRPISQGLMGPLTEACLGRISADRVFLGADGLDAKLGICEAELAQTWLKEQMIARSRVVYVLADSSKVGAAPFHAWTTIDREWTLVTDDGASAGQLAPFHAMPAVTVVTVPLENRHDQR